LLPTALVLGDLLLCEFSSFALFFVLPVGSFCDFSCVYPSPPVLFFLTSSQSIELLMATPVVRHSALTFTFLLSRSFRELGTRCLTSGFPLFIKVSCSPFFFFSPLGLFFFFVSVKAAVTGAFVHFLPRLDPPHCSLPIPKSTTDQKVFPTGCVSADAFGFVLRSLQTLFDPHLLFNLLPILPRFALVSRRDHPNPVFWHGFSLLAFRAFP